MNPTSPLPEAPITLNDLLETSGRVDQVIQSVRETMLSPDSRKLAPSFTTTQLLATCGLERHHFEYRLKRGDLPQGTLEGNRRRFTLAEVRQWAKSVRSSHLKPSSAGAVTIAVANFKGGVTKTTTAVTLAQGLSLRGHDVLVIDTDPQGSLTTLFGLLPDVDISDEQTILPLCLGNETDVDYAIRSTYWPGIDIISANLALYSAEFALPARQKDQRNFEFWSVLTLGLDATRLKYDVIVIDTPPALSYLTINALLAADGLIMPLPPNTLDFTSSGQFWNLFNELTGNLITQRGHSKTFDFVDVLLSRVDSNDASSSIVRQWISAAYADRVLPVEVPKTALTAGASAEFGTVYDTDPSSISSRTYRRAFDAYERVVDLVEQQIEIAWKRQATKERQ